MGKRCSIEGMPEAGWKDIPGYEGRYQAHPSGLIRGLPEIRWCKVKGKPKISTFPLRLIGGPKLSTKGYCRVNLGGKVHMVHRMVANTFIFNLKNKPQINHINGIKTDNRVENLEWVTNQENRNHAKQMRLIARGENSGHNIFNWNQIQEIRELRASGLLQREVAARFGVTQQCIQKIVSLKTWAFKD